MVTMADVMAAWRAREPRTRVCQLIRMMDPGDPDYSIAHRWLDDAEKRRGR